ncbi:MAG: hydantoinase/oxoprolinase family protein [Pseudomonadales bacterium]|nr:hydantoinase/oxoprolinase family protein [Pseudomonadales bacterium]
MTSKSNRLAIDIGGTFTDVVLELSSEGATSYAATKVLTTHTNPAEGVMLGVARVTSESDTPLDTIGLVIHGTTLATNAIIERKGARTAFLTTEGHRDVLGMAFENRFEQYDVNIERPEPLVPRYLRLPIPERISATGKVLVPLELDAVDKAIEVCVKEDVTSVVIGFLHSYVNSTHEELVAERVRERISSISVTTSSSVCPEIREYERFTTACANGYVLPLMSRYLRELSDGLKQLGCDCPCLMMTSGGGLMSFVNAARFPVRLVESGPAGGAIMVSHLAESRDIGKVLSFDMGGTTAKICLIDEGEPQLSRSFEVDRRYRFKKGSGLPLRIPVIEMVEIGAGGGSIASIDALQRIQVGPESSGSDPGPACYGLGGTSATVTDADVVLGRLDPDRFANGHMQLDVSAAHEVIDRDIASFLGFETTNAAFGITEVVTENMASAARAHAMEWGKSLDDRTLVAFGGAAPLHAAGLADKLGIDRVLIPEGAGVGSAIGFLVAPVSYEVVRSRYLRLSRYDHMVVEQVVKEMREDAAEVLTDSVLSERPKEVVRAFMRYVGQGYEIAVEIDPVTASEGVLRTAFDRAYEQLYGRLIPGLDIEVMSWTLSLAENKQISIEGHIPAASHLDQRDHQSMYEEGTMKKAVILDRSNMGPDISVTGPGLVVEEQTTTVVPSHFQVTVNRHGDLVLERLH